MDNQFFSRAKKVFRLKKEVQNYLREGELKYHYRSNKLAARSTTGSSIARAKLAISHTADMVRAIPHS